MTVEPVRKPRFDGPWIIAACFVTFGLASGLPYYNIVFFFDYLRDDHGWTQQTITLGPPIGVLLTIWAGPLIAPRVSPRLLIVVGTGLTCLAFQWFARLGGSSLEYYAACCVYMLGYFLSGPIPHQIILSNWYSKRRGRAMGIAYVGGAAIGAIGTKLAPWLAEAMPYRSALAWMGMLLLIAWPAALFILKDRPEDVGQHPDGDADAVAGAAAASAPHGFGQLMGTPSFWLLLAGSAASIGSIASMNFLMKFVLEEQGFTSQAARNAIWSTASSTALMACIVGRLISGPLADRYPRKQVMLATYVIVAVSIPLLFLVTPAQPEFVYLFAIVYGMSMGADYMLIPLMAADLFGVRSLGRAMSMIVPSDTVTQYWCPNLVAALRMAWGGYGAALWVACGLAAMGAAAIACLPGRRQSQAAAAAPLDASTPEPPTTPEPTPAPTSALRRTLVLLIAAVVGGMGFAVVRAQDPELPDKPGKDMVQSLCGSTCHGIGTVLKERRTPASWKITVHEMMERGAPGSDEDFAAVIAFLAAHVARINVNKADAAVLKTFLEISPAQAEAIVAFRTAHGAFKKLDDLKRIPDIDGATLQRCKDRIAFEG